MLAESLERLLSPLDRGGEAMGFILLLSLCMWGLILERTLPIISTVVQVLPLLGLLGTVTGMIETFEVITVFGGSNRRGVAGGISEALLCTMAGLVTALSGLYSVVHLEQRARASAAAALQAMKED